MSQGIAAYIAQREAEAQAAAVLAEAIAKARELLTAAGCDDPEEILGAIWDADGPQ